MMDIGKILDLFKSELVVINVGSHTFASALEKQGYTAVQVDWVPPAGGDKKLQEILKIMGGLH